MLLCDRVQENAYRVLRLSASCTRSEIYSAASAMSRAVVIGRCGTTDDDLPILGDMIRSEASVRAAVGALSNPGQRIAHRLFWFHRRPSHADPDRPQESAWRATEKTHDDALRGLIAAYAEQQGETGPMVPALTQWHQFVTQPEYWEILNRIEADGGFEPAIDAEEISALQHKAMALAAEPFAGAAKKAWQSKDLAGVRDYLAAFAVLEGTGRWATDCRKNLIVPVTTQLTDACETLRREYREQILYEESAVAANKYVCAGELQYYRGFVETAWKELNTVLTENEAELRLGRGQTADCLADVAIDQSWTDQHILAQDLAWEANELAAGTIVEPRIRQKLLNLVEAREKRRKGECAKATAAFRSALESFRDAYPERAFPDKPTLNDNKETCAQALRFYRDRIVPALDLLVQLSEDSLQRMDCRAHAARCLLVTATEFAWANEFTVAEELARKAISLAEGTAAAGAMQQGLARLQESATMQNTSTAAVEAAVAALRQQFATIARAFAGKVVARDGYGRDNELVCREELAYFRSQIEPPFLDLLTHLQPDDQVVLDLREQAAACLAGIAADHTWADQFMAAERLIEESLTLAQGTWAVSPIRKKYLLNRKSARTEQPDKSRSRMSFTFPMTMACLLAVAAAGLSMWANDKTASTSDTHRVQGATTPINDRRSAPPASDAQPNPIEQTVSRKETPVVSKEDVEEPLEEPIQRLKDEIELLKQRRAAGALVDSEVLNTKLYQYSSLLRKRRRLVQLANEQDRSPNK